MLATKKPVTNGLRHQNNFENYLLSKQNRINKNLLFGIKNWAGRNSRTGHITIRHKGGGVKKIYRQLLFSNYHYYAISLIVCKDPYRSAFLSYNYNVLTKETFYTLHVYKSVPGSLLVCNSSVDEYKLGYRLKVANLPLGALIHNISTIENRAGQYIKAAGTIGQLIQKTSRFCQIRLPSGKILVSESSGYATLGAVSNKAHNKCVLGKAGRSRLKNVRPTIRGVAMNPVDHPHGGRTNGGRPSVTPWGLPTKGKPTAKKRL
jgi:large subunit ribosomal protein L2